MVDRPSIEGVVFDVGYTLVDETRRWHEWARWIKVEPEQLMSSLRNAIAEGVHHREALKRLAPDLDLGAARAEMRRDEFIEEDLYPDVSPCIGRLRAAGIKLGAAGNMSADVETFLAGSGLGFDMIGSSGRWGVEKPNHGFFRHVIDAMRMPAQSLMYVGDRLDNDIGPAARAGMRPVFLRRGPWAEILEAGRDLSDAYAVIDSLEELPSVFARPASMTR